MKPFRTLHRLPAAFFSHFCSPPSSMQPTDPSDLPTGKIFDSGNFVRVEKLRKTRSTFWSQI